MKIRLLLAVGALLLFLTGCAKDIGQAIEADLLTITTDTKSQASSNPGVYMANQQKACDDIISYGDAGLEYLVKTLKSSESSGLKEWIMAYACAEILGEQNPVKQWATSEEWLSGYELAKVQK
ncbi:hypothetical protein BC351_21130 [Paenibacillus ferrarius]|uniref:Lipoprotein n=1 Tax=Paenibacillus ferrarius TaxID=1469647 RepID=A0A1V4HNV6_9BACL|nr:hypothetical protein [Paenibacillus ferrarius]OPH59412.1 hypothetical protein BC351_21130 [Paenibacillus ferrarius]